MKQQCKIISRYIYLEKVDTYLCGELYKLTVVEFCSCGSNSLRIYICYPEDVE